MDGACTLIGSNQEYQSGPHQAIRAVQRCGIQRINHPAHEDTAIIKNAAEGVTNEATRHCRRNVTRSF
jgi:hypothetical protein